ncbi:glucose/galactose MFS transporter [Paraflavitalea speifideaquila]|uniref:glucose/galactose MFS transporter n=1 Tax=Paraflavitalea speifideaquila TaxID=3076558 RepID=UPI0028E59368|nr:glucose/galactose MFS transporter [Paraflavitalea speifideiaquila]
MVNGMSLGLIIMAVGCLSFIPAAYARSYLLFLLGLFIVGTGLTLLQTAVNPYITLLGPESTAARRISIMGVCNKVAGIPAPLVMGSIILKNSNGLLAELARLSPEARSMRLDELSRTVILPYSCLTIILLVVAIAIRYAHLPEINKPDAGTVSSGHHKQAKLSPVVRKQFLLGFLAIFACVGAEVMAGDTIGNYGLYHGVALDISKSLTSYTLAGMMIGYLAGIFAIPRYISQQNAFYYSTLAGLFFTLLILILPGQYSIICVALLGCANALLWPAIWPQALKGLQGNLLNKGAAILIMGIAGGALLPLLYGWLATVFNNQQAYWILVPVYVFLIYYSFTGKKQANSYQSLSVTS